MVEYDNSINNGFTKFPNKFIWNYKSIDDTLLKTIDVMSLSVLAYIDNNIVRNSGVSRIYIKEMIEFIGKKPRAGKDGINNKIKNILQQLNEKGYIKILSGDISNINKIIEVKTNFEFIKNKKGKSSEYFDIKTDSYNKIFSIKDSDNISLFNSYCYILSRIKRRVTAFDKNGNPMATNKDINAFGGEAEIFFGKIEEFARDLKMSNSTVTTLIDILVENKLIFKGNLGRIRKGKFFKNSVNVYALNKDELREGLKQIKYSYENDGYTIEKVKSKKEIKDYTKEKEELVNYISEFLVDLRINKSYSDRTESIWNFYVDTEEFNLKDCKNNYKKLCKAKKVIENLEKEKIA